MLFTRAPALAAVQYRPPKGAPDAARGDLARLVTEAGERGARLIVCPEMATTGYVWDDEAEIAPHCEPAGGPTFEALAPLAARFGAWIFVGFAERGEDGLYNSALVIDERGRLAGCYRKVLLYEADLSWARAGTRRHLYDAAGARVAPGICMDINDYAFGIYLRTERPDVVAFCTNWVDEGEDVLPYWRRQLSGWRGWFVAANTWGSDRGVPFRGRSAILNPSGRAVASAAAEGDAVLVHRP